MNKSLIQKGKFVAKQNIDVGRVQYQNMKTKLEKEYYRKVRELLKTEFKAKNKIALITTLAVPVIPYSIDIIKWTQANIRKMDAQIRKLLTIYGALHLQVDGDRLYIPRQDGGRGKISLDTTYKLKLNSPTS